MNGDQWAEKVQGRIIFARDLIAFDVLYHNQCNVNFRNMKKIPKMFNPEDDNVSSVGRKKDEENENAFQMVLDEFYENEGTITISEFVSRMGKLVPNPYSRRTVKRKLENIEGIIITDNIVSTKCTAKEVLKEFHSKNTSRMSDDDWQMHIIETAAKLVRAETREKEYQRDFYPDITNISDIQKHLDYVPPILRHFLEVIFKNRTTNMKTAIAAISQAIMQQQRPRHIMAPLIFALTIRIYDDCPGLLNYLSKCGFSMSEDEAKRFKVSAALDRPNPFASMEGKFGWIIGDNFDHNKITLTGHGTIHAMGLMLAKTNIPQAQVATSTFTHQIKRELPNEKASKTIEIREITQHRNTREIIYKIASDIIIEDDREHLDMLWKISLAYATEKRGWQGYMTAITNGEKTNKASFDFLPMVNLDPNSWNCIYSVLMWGKKECERYGLDPIFTFDQPIWWNARQIKNQEDELASVILNLGGFHTDMSFLGAIGNIMQCSGLKQILSLIYPENTVSHMLSGKAVYRAIRGYFLVDAALNILIIKNYIFKDEESASYFLKMFNDTFDNKDETQAINDQKMFDLCKMFKDEKEKLKIHPTGALWIQFMDLCDHLRTSLRAQRTGNFQLYKKSLQNRQPYFPATGRNNYAKSIMIFLQDLVELEHTNPNVYEMFLKGYFFVRRSDRYWAALPPDLVIEQVLMASLKDCRSGITHGRGTDENQILTWLYSRPVFAQLKIELDHLFKQDSKPIIKELTVKRVQVDTRDIGEVLEYLEQHDPFKAESQDLVDISNGISYGNSNAHKALDVGKEIMKKMDGIAVSKFTFKKAYKIKQMGEKVKIGKDLVIVDPLLMIERGLIIC